tara:strand:- start:6 stop:215 length:210 start_codon:yes stop_codon:yes gene_type:complete
LPIARAANRAKAQILRPIGPPENFYNPAFLIFERAQLANSLLFLLVIKQYGLAVRSRPCGDIPLVFSAA